MPPLRVGDNALVKITEFDRGRADPANLIVVILEIHDGTKYVVGTKHGRLDRRLERNALDTTRYNAISLTDVPGVEYSLRELVKLASVGTGQGYRRCLCRQKCGTNRCSCFKGGLKCNSACHPRTNCNNH